MRQLLLPILFATFFVACDTNVENSSLKNLPDLAEIRVKESPCETLEYVGKIGTDFNAALDSLRKLKNILSGIDKALLEVLFDYDNREFYGIAYGDCGMYADVLDTEGNYYLRSWYCPDENDIQEESIFVENKRFTINHGCAAIVYESRIGSNFDAALDSLKIVYKQTLDRYGKDGYYVEKEDMVNVDFSYDDRIFFLLTFIDKENSANLLITNVVIDERGCYFYLDMGLCKD